MASVFYGLSCYFLVRPGLNFGLGRRREREGGGGGGYDMAQGYHPHNIRKPAVTSFFEHQRKKIGSVAD